jgi:hypothetical protein
MPGYGSYRDTSVRTVRTSVTASFQKYLGHPESKDRLVIKK